MTATRTDPTLKRIRYMQPEDQAQPLPAGMPAGSALYYRRPYIVIAFSGKKGKPDLYCNFTGGEAHRAAAVTRWIDSAVSEERRKQTAKTAPHNWQIGAILVSSWGYDQTNIEYYKVTAIHGRKATLQKIACEVVAWNYQEQSETVIPYPEKETNDAPITRPIKCLCYASGELSFYVELTSYASAKPWDGQPRTQTHTC